MEFGILLLDPATGEWQFGTSQYNLAPIASSSNKGYWALLEALKILTILGWTVVFSTQQYIVLNRYTQTNVEVKLP